MHMKLKGKIAEVFTDTKKWKIHPWHREYSNPHPLGSQAISDMPLTNELQGPSIHLMNN